LRSTAAHAASTASTSSTPTAAGTRPSCERDPSPDGSRAFQRFASETINTSQVVAWSSRIRFGRNGIFRGDPTLVALVGDPVPAPGTGALDRLSLANVTNAGDVVFESTISGGPAAQGLFRCSGGDGNCHAGGSGTLSVVQLAGDAVPDRVGRSFCAFEEIAASSYGVVFHASTKLLCSNGGETALEGVFRKAVAGVAETLALAGESANPFPNAGGTTYAGFPSAPTMNDSGAAAFVATTTGPGGTNALYRCDLGTCPASPATAIDISGDPDGNGNSFISFGPPAISAARDVAFTARVTGPSGNFYAVYVRRAAGGVDTIAKRGDTVPGSSPVATFHVLESPVAMSPAGKVAFKSRILRGVTPRNREGIFVDE